MGNFGTDVNAWLSVLFFLLTAAVAIFFTTCFAKLVLHARTGKPTETNRRARIRESRRLAYAERYRRLLGLTLVSGLVLVVMATAFFVAFGPGRPVQRTPAAEDGMRQLNEQAPDEKSDRQLQQEAEDKKEPSLKRQDEGPQKDVKEADDYVNDLIEKRQKGQTAPKPETKEKE